ncbi:MAG: hypothetical protein ACJAZQ_002576 [Cognaticolwellia sp.]|jgi:hypothetical protein|uniref:MFS transporter n=1 Tax=Colwellia sp. C1 TaxID=1737566 RepID=A0A0P0LXS9_9GAMM|nr:hypothetical protein [Colwellia sp. C1]
MLPNLPSTSQWGTQRHSFFLISLTFGQIGYATSALPREVI